MSTDDDQLIRECLEGNAQAFGSLVQRYQDRLCNSVFPLVGNIEDTRDVVQETFIVAYTALEQFKGHSRFYTWLTRIAFNAAVDWKRKRKPALSFEQTRESCFWAEPEDLSATCKPEHALEQQERVARVHKALHRLTFQHRAILILKEIEGKAYREIAEILEIPIGTVRSRLTRARLHLRELLEQDEEGSAY